MRRRRRLRRGPRRTTSPPGRACSRRCPPGSESRCPRQAARRAGRPPSRASARRRVALSLDHTGDRDTQPEHLLGLDAGRQRSRSKALPARTSRPLRAGSASRSGGSARARTFIARSNSSTRTRVSPTSAPTTYRNVGATRSRTRGRPPSDSTEPASSTTPSSISSPTRLLTLAALSEVRTAQLLAAQRALAVDAGEDHRAVGPAHVTHRRPAYFHPTTSPMTSPQRAPGRPLDPESIMLPRAGRKRPDFFQIVN